MWALQAWGELALGLAAPRAVHAAGNDYGNQTLAWDVVRVSFYYFTVKICACFACLFLKGGGSCFGFLLLSQYAHNTVMVRFCV